MGKYLSRRERVERAEKNKKWWAENGALVLNLMDRLDALEAKLT